MKTLLMLAFSSFIFKGCNEMGKLEGLKNSNNVQLHRLGEKSNDSLKTGKLQVEGYPVLQSYTLTGEQVNQLLNGFFNKKNYIKPVRRCEFLPQYALQQENKTVVLFELSYCPRLIYYGDSTIRMEIATSNTLKGIVEKIESGK